MNTAEFHQLPAGVILKDRYQIREVLGQGGFGITYKGYDRTLDTMVAIKEYFPFGIAYRTNTASHSVQTVSLENSKQYDVGKQKFLEEARILARVSDDPNVVSVRDFFEENETAYIVMQFLKGENLKAMIEKNGPMSFDEAWRLMQPVARSMAHIHEIGLIHRDISPSNLVLGSNGSVRLIDFGTSREFSEDEEKSLSVLLKPGYAPPEQYQSHGAQGPWTDVYAFCATIYKLITGKTPENALNRVLQDDLLAPSALGAKIGKAEEKALLRGLAVDARKRIRSMKELEEAFTSSAAVSEDPATSYGTETEYEQDDERTILGAPDGKPVSEDTLGGPENRIPISEVPLRKEDSISVPETPPEPAETGLKTAPEEEKDIRKPAEGTGKKSRRSLKKWLIIGGAAAAVLIVAVLIILGKTGGFGSGGYAGGSAASIGEDGQVRVSFSGTEITSEMVDELNANQKVTELSFSNCTIGSAAMERMGSMTHIRRILMYTCTGFTTLDPLSGIPTLNSLSFSGKGEQTVYAAETLISRDFPQLQTMSIENFTLEGSLEFLSHLSAVNQLTIARIGIGTEADTFPYLPALTNLTITSVNLSRVDLTALSQPEKLTYLNFESDELRSLSFLKGAKALQSFSASGNHLTSLDGLQGIGTLGSVTVNNNVISDISQLAECPNLSYFLASQNQISDLSSLKRCPKLRTLNLRENRITDVSALSGFENLADVNLAGNSITDLSPLQNSVEMQYLNFCGNSVTNLSFLKKMLKLQSLKASENGCSDLSPLSDLTQLKTVYLDRNGISDISVLKKSEAVLTHLVLDGNEITDLSALSGASVLQSLSLDNNALTSLAGLENCSELGFLSAAGNQIRDISALKACSKLSMADLGENEISSIEALSGTMTEKTALLLQNNQIRDLSPLDTRKNFLYLSLYGNEISDIKRLAELENVGSASRLYLGWYENFDVKTLSETGYTSIRLVEIPADKQVNLEKDFREYRREAKASVGMISFLTRGKADEEIREVRKNARATAGIKEWKEEY